MIVVTGDTHSEVLRRMKDTVFINGANIRPIDLLKTSDDYFIVCGDFGLIWDYKGPSVWENQELDVLEKKPFIILFVDGNHENFDRLNSYPVLNWKGGKVHRIRKNILHLMRGQIFELPNGDKTERVFTFGGARSHDIQDGVLDPVKDQDKIIKWSTINKAIQLYGEYPESYYKYFRIRGQTWWEQERPSEAEYEEGLANLDKVGWKVDYILTHDCGSDLRAKLGFGKVEDNDRLNSFLKLIRKQCHYKMWYFGHLHKDLWLTDRDCLLYHRSIPIGISKAESIKDM